MAFYKAVYLASPAIPGPLYHEAAAYLTEYSLEYSTLTGEPPAAVPCIWVVPIEEAAPLSVWRKFIAGLNEAENSLVVLLCRNEEPLCEIKKEEPHLLDAVPCVFSSEECAVLVKQLLLRGIQPDTRREEAGQARKERGDDALRQVDMLQKTIRNLQADHAKASAMLRDLAGLLQEEKASSSALKEHLESSSARIADLESVIRRPRLPFTALFALLALDLALLIGGSCYAQLCIPVAAFTQLMKSIFVNCLVVPMLFLLIWQLTINHNWAGPGDKLPACLTATLAAALISIGLIGMPRLTDQAAPLYLKLAMLWTVGRSGLLIGIARNGTGKEINE